MPIQRCRSLMPTRSLILAIVVAVVISFSTELRSNAVRAEETAGSSSEAKDEKDTNGKPTNEARKRNEKRLVAYYSGMAAIIGIVLTGFGLVAMISVWGRKLRRQFRKDVPAAELPERDFWFLKPQKPTAAETKLPDSHFPPHDESSRHSDEVPPDE